MLKKIKRFPKFLKETKEELKKVSWSTREELRGAIVVVVVVFSLLTAYLTLVDLGLSELVQLLLK